MSLYGSTLHAIPYIELCIKFQFNIHIYIHISCTASCGNNLVNFYKFHSFDSQLSACLY